jgi:hypothetical protein
MINTKKNNPMRMTRKIPTMRTMKKPTMRMMKIPMMRLTSTSNVKELKNMDLSLAQLNTAWRLVSTLFTNALMNHNTAMLNSLMLSQVI